MKIKQSTILISTTLFIIGFIFGTFSGILYTTLHDIKNRGDANKAFIEDYIVTNNNSNVDVNEIMSDYNNKKNEIIGISNKDAKTLNPKEIIENDTYLICINEDINIEEYAISFVNNYLKDEEKILSVLNTKTNIMHLIAKNETEDYVYVTSIEYRNNGNKINEENEDLFVQYEINLETKNITKY